MLWCRVERFASFRAKHNGTYPLHCKVVQGTGQDRIGQDNIASSDHMSVLCCAELSCHLSIHKLHSLTQESILICSREHIDSWYIITMGRSPWLLTDSIPLSYIILPSIQ